MRLLHSRLLLLFRAYGPASLKKGRLRLRRVAHFLATFGRMLWRRLGAFFGLGVHTGGSYGT